MTPPRIKVHGGELEAVVLTLVNGRTLRTSEHLLVVNMTGALAGAASSRIGRAGVVVGAGLRPVAAR